MKTGSMSFPTTPPLKTSCDREQERWADQKAREYRASFSS